MTQLRSFLGSASGRRTAIGLTIVVVSLLPFVTNPYQQDVLTQAASFALFAVGLNVVVGLAGLLDLGYVAFWAIGAYTMAIFSGAGPLQFAHLNVWAILPIGVLLTMISGVLIGFPVLRLRGDYLAIVTLGFGEIIRITASNLDGVTRGARGIPGIPQPEIAGFRFGTSPTPYFYLTAGMLLIAVFLINNLNRSRIGRAWVAIREDEVAAEAMGIDTARHKLYAFLLSAVGPGVVGGLFARDQGYIEPISVFPLLTTITMIVMCLFGGKGTVFGPVLGAVALFVLQELVWVRFLFLHQILFGAIISVVVLFMPRGVLGVLQQRYRLPRYV